ncbi:hypothetical protein KIW84_033693 [Lathyrus oleraceus]|uniref:Ubiquitin-like protease family profile domain-containing protein n=1 Tax=Pisum sativum TaxID=3888 RepID=A0A9D5B436_PEA|nr:hypothetical protein KIW84_033693 [Pisum sativum]
MADNQQEEVSKKVSAEEEIRRGITVMRRVVQGRSRGIILDVCWNNQGQLIEPNGHTLTSFIGALVRNEIPITCDDWRNKELNESKEKIWSEVFRCFNIEEERRGFCMKLAGKLLRGFRTFLSSKFLKDADGNFVDAELPKKYESLISAEEWEAFKSKRQDPVFQRISATNRERASSPAYPYRKGRVGYGRLEQSMLQKEESSETSLPAHVLWKEARVGKSGVPQEEVLHVYQKCEELSQSISPNDTKGILSRALDVPEYSGRVRGKGFGVTPTSLSVKKGKAPSNRELHARLEAMQAELDALRREREASASTVYRDASDKNSINCTFQPNIPEGISHCQLYLSSPYYRMVGKGKVHNVSGVLLHTRELPAGCLKVSVDIAVEPNAALPYPSDDSDATTVHEAVGSFVAWPTNLICVGYEMASNEDHPHGDETVGVPITCDNWRNKQLNEAKDKIWSEIKRCFDIEENRRDHCLKLAGKLLRGFRTFLSTTFLRDTEGTFVDAELPSKYASLISPKEWETFKSKRKTQEFKSVSETNRQRASSPAYPYRKGRVGYGRLEQSILTKENSSETSLPAHVLWKEARVGKDGKIKEDVQQIFEKCETLSQSIVPYEDTDCRSILSRALDVPEYSGRVRGKGFGITQKSLNIKKQKTPSNKELQQTLEALKAEVLELRKERERDRAAGFKDTSDKDSINCNFQPTIPEGISPCHLYLARPTYRMVGKGKVHNNLSELLHTKPLPTGSLKVSVDIALEKDALLPHPDDVSDATLLGDAIGSFVAWPTDLIIVGYETPTKSKAKDKGIAREIESVASQKEIPVAKKTEISKRTGAKKKNPSKYRACLHTYLETTDISDGCVRLIPMDGAIFGFEYAEPLGKEDFDQILYHTQLSVGVINTYMRYLYDKLMGPRGLEQRFSFLNPMKTNLTEMIRKPDEVRTYVVERFMADTDREKLFFLPFNTGDGGHWLLVAINPFKEIVYYLDSLHNDWTTYPAMKTKVDTIIQTVRAQRKIQVPKRKANNITWNRVECPRQRNNIDCGYYTLRFMKETLLMDRTDIPSDYFDEYRCAYYSKDQLDEIKEELCQFIIELQVL